MAAKIPIIATTTNNSIKVKPDSLCKRNLFIVIIPSLRVVTWSVNKLSLLIHLITAVNTIYRFELSPPFIQSLFRLVATLAFRSAKHRPQDFLGACVTAWHKLSHKISCNGIADALVF
jgi:hypothetical protein